MRPFLYLSKVKKGILIVCSSSNSWLSSLSWTREWLSVLLSLDTSLQESTQLLELSTRSRWGLSLLLINSVISEIFHVKQFLGWFFEKFKLLMPKWFFLWQSHGYGSPAQLNAGKEQQRSYFIILFTIKLLLDSVHAHPLTIYQSPSGKTDDMKGECCVLCLC